MAVVPAVPTITPGTLPTSVLAQIAAALTFAQNPPAAALRQSVATTLTTSVWAPVGFDLSDEDNVGGHSTSVNNSRYTAQYAGYYWVSGGINSAFNATGIRGARWAVNGNPYNGGTSVAFLLPIGIASFNTGLPNQAQRLFLNVGDFVELQAFQSSGGNLTVNNCLMSIMFGGVT